MNIIRYLNKNINIYELNLDLKKGTKIELLSCRLDNDYWCGVECSVKIHLEHEIIEYKMSACLLEDKED